MRKVNLRMKSSGKTLLSGKDVVLTDEEGTNLPGIITKISVEITDKPVRLTAEFVLGGELDIQGALVEYLPADEATLRICAARLGFRIEPASVCRLEPVYVASLDAGAKTGH